MALTTLVVFVATTLKFAVSLTAVYHGEFPQILTPTLTGVDLQGRVIVYGGRDEGTHQENQIISSFNLTSGDIEVVGSFPQLQHYQGVSGTDAEGNIFYFMWASSHSNLAVWIINITDFSVTRIETTLPPKLSYFQVVSDNMGSIYILGGSIKGNDEEYYTIRKFNTETYEVSVEAISPVSLVYTSAVCYEHDIYLFVWTPPDIKHQVVYRYKPTIGSFEFVQNLTGSLDSSPIMRVGHIAYIFNGFTKPGDDLIYPYHYTEFDLKTYSFENYNITNLGDPNIDDHYLPWNPVYAESTNEIIMVGGIYWNGFNSYASIYRVQL